MNEIKKMIGELTTENRAVKALEQIRGISVITPSTLMGEIIDIGRFANDDHLASHAGLGRSEYARGDRSKMIPNPQFNHRLKDVFITVAKNFAQNNPDSHLTGYFRNLVKKRKMKPNQAYKRVARAPVRVIFRRPKSVVEDPQKTKKGAKAIWQADRLSAVTKVTKATYRNHNEAIGPRACVHPIILPAALQQVRSQVCSSGERISP